MRKIMNFELQDKLRELTKRQGLGEAIKFAESELKKIPTTGFHQIIGRNILHLSDDLKPYIQSFHELTTVVLNKPKGFIGLLFGKPKNLFPAAYYCEMNGFTINYDRWFIDLFSFKEMRDDNWGWLCDFYDSTSDDFTITGLEGIQAVFKDVHENERFEEPNIGKAYNVCELLVILRLHELLQSTYSKITEPLSGIPMFVSAHDYELIYQVNLDK